MAERYIDYDKVFQDEVKRLGGRKPRLLLHACCGPCSCHPLEELVPYFEVTILYSNSNIYPQSEFERREKELTTLLADLKRDRCYEVGLLLDDYDYETYMKDLRPFPDDKEGGRRCQICYEKRLRRAFEVAAENDFEYVTTTLTLSRFKPSPIINRIASKVALDYPQVKYLHSDFKKRGGIDKGKLIQRHYGLYQQLYCGCEFSYAGGLERAKKLGLKDLYHPIDGPSKSPETK